MQITKTTTTKTKRRLALFVALIMLLSLWVTLPQRASADETDSSTYLTYTVADGNATITGYEGSDKATKQSINIPASVGANIPVTNIDAHALSDLTALTAITTNNPHYSIEDGVLFNADKTILVRYPAGKSGAYTTMPSSVTTIGRDAFRQSKLTAVTIPNSVTATITQAFLDCAELSSVTISASDSLLTSIGGSTFARTKLASFIIPESVTSIGNNAFHSTPLTSITIPDGVTSIGNSAFYGCTKLASVTISKESALKSIGT
jgi:hypothetical protein